MPDEDGKLTVDEAVSLLRIRDQAQRFVIAELAKALAARRGAELADIAGAAERLSAEAKALGRSGDELLYDIASEILHECRADEPPATG